MKPIDVNATDVTELALQLSWTERLTLAQALLGSLHPPAAAPAPALASQADPPVKSLALPTPIPGMQARKLQLEGVSESFRKLRDALESNVEP